MSEILILVLLLALIVLPIFFGFDSREGRDREPRQDTQR